jgi:hypothetical protein
MDVLQGTEEYLIYKRSGLLIVFDTATGSHLTTWGNW